MKIKHRVPVAAIQNVAVVDGQYESYVQRVTARAEKAFADARRRLEKAEARRASLTEQTQRRPNDAALRRRLKSANAAVESRRQELLAIQSLMVAHPASVEHRGTGQAKPIFSGGVL